MQAVLDTLLSLDIVYKVYKHPAVFTTTDAEKYKIDEDYVDNKNLFLRNKNATAFYLVTIPAYKKLDMKRLAKQSGEQKLSFASEKQLDETLGLTPGSVSPFGLINNAGNDVTYILDREIMHYPKVGFHPNRNIQTIVISTNSFKRFLEHVGNRVEVQTLGGLD